MHIVDFGNNFSTAIMAATSEQSIDERNVITVISEGQLEATAAATGATYEYIPLTSENSNGGGPHRDALQAALESAEVDKMELLRTSDGTVIYENADSHPSQAQDPRLQGDPYLISGQYNANTRVGNGVESPTYIQLENASAVNSITKGGAGYTAGIYSPPTSYRQDYGPVSDHQIYSLRGNPRGQFHNIYDPANAESWREYNSQYVRTEPGYIPQGAAKNPSLGHYAHYVPTAATANIPYMKEPIAARFNLEPDGSVQPYHEPQCITCHAPLNASNWRRDGGTAQQCDSCANYAKMNGIRGLPSSQNSSGARKETPPARRVSNSSSSSSVSRELETRRRSFALKICIQYQMTCCAYRVAIAELDCLVPIVVPILPPYGGEMIRGNPCATRVDYTSNFTM